MKEEAWLHGFAMGAVLAFAVTALLVTGTIGGVWEAMTVRQGCAQYDPITGEWGWKKEKPE